MNPKKELSPTVLGFLYFIIYLGIAAMFSFIFSGIDIAVRTHLPGDAAGSLAAAMVGGLIAGIPATWIGVALAANVVNSRYVVRSRRALIGASIIGVAAVEALSLAYVLLTTGVMEGTWLFPILSFVEDVVLLILFGRAYLKTTVGER